MPGTKVSKTFSPTCGCARGKANIVIKLRRADVLTVKVLDSSRRPVRILAAGVFTHRGFSTFRWDGRTDLTARAPDGTYQAEVHLAQQHQTILLPNKIQLDTTVPVVRDATPIVQELAGRRQAGRLRPYRVPAEQARTCAALSRRQSHCQYVPAHASGSVSWNGQAHGQTLPAGDIHARAWSDRSGRQHHSGEAALAPAAANPLTSSSPSAKIHAARRSTFRDRRLDRREAVLVAARQAKGVASSPVLRLLAPGRKGRYTLTVSEHGHANRAAVFVR